MLFLGELIYIMVARCGIWEKSNIFIFRLIVCEMFVCCFKRVIIVLIRMIFWEVKGFVLEGDCFLEGREEGGGVLD